MKKRKSPLRNKVIKRQSKTSTTNAMTTQTKKPPSKKAHKKPVFKPARRNQVKQTSAVNKQKIDPVKSRKMKIITPVKKPTPNSQVKKGTQNKNKSNKSIVIKKGASTNKPVNVKASKNKPNKNNTVEVAQKVVKQFMSTMQKMMKNIEKKSNNTNPVNKVIQKRSMPIKNQTPKKGSKPIFVAKPVPKIKKIDKKDIRKRYTPKPKTTKKWRNKREINTVDFTTPYFNSSLIGKPLIHYNLHPCVYLLHKNSIIFH